MFPSILEDRPMNSRHELLFSKSIISLLPALSSKRFSFRSKWIKVLFTFKGYAKNRDPSYPTQLSPRFRCVKIWVFRRNFAIFLAPESPILLWERSSCEIVLFSIRFFIRIEIKSSSIKLPGNAKWVRLWVVLRHWLNILASDIFIPNRGRSYSIPTCLAP